MDIVATLRAKIATLPDGDYTAGIRAVLLHVETSISHLQRGQRHMDDTAFTDAIYRTNQAFEGSIKEAYRVLARRDPANQRPFDIENYLEAESILRPRVLSQFTTYRKDWRNPSTHDYKLDFDASEAFLAIVSVCAFACVPIDQIAERVAFEMSKAGNKSHVSRKKSVLSKPGGLAGFVCGVLTEFNNKFDPASIQSDAQLYGSVRGLLSSFGDLFQVLTEVELQPGRPEKASLILDSGTDRVEILMMRSSTMGSLRLGLLFLEHQMALGGIRSGVLFMYHPTAGPLENWQRKFADSIVYILAPISRSAHDQTEASAESMTSAGDES